MLRDFAFGELESWAAGFTNEGQFKLSGELERKADIQVHIIGHDVPDLQGAVARVIEDELLLAAPCGTFGGDAPHLVM